MILAAGFGERLRGRVPQFWKPLMLVDGMPLVSTAVQQAIDLDCNRVIVVVSPNNAAPLDDILPESDRIALAVQRTPRGSGDALLQGLQLAQDRSTLVLMGDNLSKYDDVRRIVDISSSTKSLKNFIGGIGVKTLPADEENVRFTRRRLVDGKARWVEKVPYERGDLQSYPSQTITAWIGPIVVHTDVTRSLLQEAKKATSFPNELQIGPYLDIMTVNSQVVHVDTVDVGTYKSAEEVTVRK